MNEYIPAWKIYGLTQASSRKAAKDEGDLKEYKKVFLSVRLPDRTPFEWSAVARVRSQESDNQNIRQKAKAREISILQHRTKSTSN